MTQALHSQARTTHLIRAEIRASTLSQAELARRYNVTRQTIRKWQDRDSPADGSHCPKRMYTTLTPDQERIVVELRKTLLLPTDDLLAVTLEFINPAVSRSGRLPLRLGALSAPSWRAQSSGFYRSARMRKTGRKEDIQGLRAWLFTYRYQVLTADAGRNSTQVFVCRHRPRHNYVKVYNHNIAQRALKHQTPIQTLKKWQEMKPDLFVKRVYNQAGLDNFMSKADHTYVFLKTRPI
jgi:transposase-like protein